MKKIFLLLFILFIAGKELSAQKIIPIEYNGKKYEVLDMTSKGKVMWGGYNEEVTADGAKSGSNGMTNTKAIVAFVGENVGFDGKPYAAKLCRDATNGAKDDWYLPSRDESDAIYAFKDKI